MTENQAATIVVSAAMKVHTVLGPGLLESAYETALVFELKNRGLNVERQIGIPIVYAGISLGEGFRADLIVDGKVIVEIKSLEAVPKVAYKILLSYLRLSGHHLGLLINFGEESLKNGIKRVVDRLE